MLPEKHNRLSGLNDKLAALDELPGEPPANQQALWQKLQQRLEKKPRKQYAFMYGAAACVLFLIGAAYVHWATQERDSVKNKATNITQTKKPRTTVQANTGYAFARPRNITKEQKKHAAAKPASIQRDNNMQKDALQKETVVATAISEKALAQKNTPTAPQDTAQQMVAQMRVKKLKVVHINELGEPAANKMVVQSNSALAAQTSNQVLQENFSGISYSGNRSDEIIKIRLTPTN